MKATKAQTEQRIAQCFALIASIKAQGKTVYGTAEIAISLGIPASTIRQTKPFAEVRAAIKEIYKRDPKRHGRRRHKEPGSELCSRRPAGENSLLEAPKEDWVHNKKIKPALRQPLRGSTDEERWKDWAGGRDYIPAVD